MKPRLIAALSAMVALTACGGQAAPPAPSTPAPASSTAAKPAASTPASAAASAAAKPAVSASAKPAVAPSGAVSSSPAGALKTMKIAVPTKGSAFSYLYVAQDLGFFKNHGIDAQIAVIPPSNAVAALEGDLDYTATVGSTIRAALRGLPVRVTMVGSNRPDFVVLGAKGLTSIDQLKGKVIGVDAPQTTSNVMLTELLKKKGFQTSDYKTLTATNDEARMAQLTSNQVSASIVEVSTAVLFQKQGYPTLATVNEFPEEPFVGLGAAQSSLQKKRDLLGPGMQAVLEGVDAMRTQKDKVTPVLVKEFGLSADDAGSIYDGLKPAWTTDGKPSQAATDFELTNDQQAMELKQKPTPEQVYDFSLLDSLSKR
jgi:NitT/TauT family transport system substrate-binding protein